MLKYSLCIEPVLPELSLTDRVKAAADAGYGAIEFWDPAGRDAGGIAAAAAACGVAVAGCTLLEPWKYRLNMPWDVVSANIRRSLAVAGELGCGTMIGLAGDLEGRPDSQKSILTANLRRAADLFEKACVTLVLECLNSLVDHKGYYLDSSAVGFEIAKCVDSPRVKVLYDIYHMQIMEGNIIAAVSRNIGLIGHFHAAGVPGRHEPMSGENNYPLIMRKIDALGYDRYVGLEYWPAYDHAQSIRDSLRHMKGQ